jgi:SAM-dependent methyltransferase
MLFIKRPMFCCLGLAIQACLSTIAIAFVIKLSNNNGSPASCLAPKRGLTKGWLKAVIYEPEDSQFGRQDYWNQLYEKQSNFSWYAGWEDLKPFVDEFLDKSNDRVLIPGVGNDATLVDMYDDGYVHLTAMDYAPEGIERCREMLGSSRTREHDCSESGGVELVVADARDLKGVFDDHSFDAVMEKGTLDAIFLSGGHDKSKSEESLNLAISELGRCVNPGGIWISVAAVVDDKIQASLDDRKEWESLVRKGDLFITEDGYTSNNVDGTLLVWRKTS